MFEGILDLGTGPLLLLGLSLLVALAFEFVNGFHDTANAVATVIYTHSLEAKRAVVLSGICNFLGVFMGGIAVAMSIIHLLPVELLVSNGVGAGLAMVLSLLIGAIIWNLGTWFFGIPASSSHTLIGAILGVGLANSMLPGHTFGSGVNWGKAEHVGLSLLISPVFGFVVAGGLLLLARRLLEDEALYEPPRDNEPPPRWIRWLLIGTCSGVSFAHGSNDGQKGIGLVMLILIGLFPAGFALNHAAEPAAIKRVVAAAGRLEAQVAAIDSAQHPAAGQARQHLAAMRARLNVERVGDIPRDQRWAVRMQQLEFERSLETLEAAGALKSLPASKRTQLDEDVGALRELTDYAPTFVLVLVALALGVGTMIGWKRIVVTVGEKIGEEHLTYAQGASAELVAMSTIGVAAIAGLPVSTTHVLSSGVAGTMTANGSKLQSKTVRNIALAWILTLPVSMLLSGGLYLLFRWLFV